jgi:hypothetical protein
MPSTIQRKVSISGGGSRGPITPDQFFVATRQGQHVVGAYKCGIDLHIDAVACNLGAQVDHLRQRIAAPRTDIECLACRRGRKQPAVAARHHAHVGKIACDRQVAQFDAALTALEVRDDLRQQEILGLAPAGVVKRTDDNDRQLVHPQARHVFHGQLADGVVVGRRRRDRLVDDGHAGVAIDIRRRGQQDG